MLESKRSLNRVFNDVKSILVVEGFKVSNSKTIDYGMQFLVTENNLSGIIRIYQNKKNKLKFDYSLIKSPNFKLKIQSVIEENYHFSDDLERLKKVGLPIIGTDEAGKGDYFGSLVSAAVYVDEEIARRLIAIGARDSKNLTDEQNTYLASKIKDICKYYAIIEIDPPKYNKLYNKYSQENQNLNNLLAWSHAQVIEEILSQVDCAKAIVDQFAHEKTLLEKLEEKGKKLSIIQMHHAEENVAVAAASILARSRFLESLDQLSKIYNIKFPKGSLNDSIRAGKEFLNKFKKKELINVAKLHFKTTISILDGM